MLGSILSSLSGARFPGWSTTQTALRVAATAFGAAGSLIGSPIGRPVLALSRTSWFARPTDNHTEFPLTEASLTPTPTRGA